MAACLEFRGSFNNLGRFAENPIYISESLTEMNKKLLKSALSCKNDLKYQFIWTLYGNIFLQKTGKEYERE